MEKFTIAIEKKQLITHEELLSLGWQERIYSLDHALGKRRQYGKGNFWLLVEVQEGYEIMRVVAIDPTKIEWLPNDPGTFRLTFKRPTLEAFKIIMAHI